MIKHFLTYIYQRNILASLVKYILLKDLLIQFNNSYLSTITKGIFFLMNKRLNELVFECILTAFNCSNYDNYLIANYLIIIQTEINQKIKIYKKGASISTIYLSFKKNINKYIYKKKGKAVWPMFLYIKDIRNLVAANMSLDKLGKLFNLKESKLCFPYSQAVSVKQLKLLTSLKPYDDIFWKDTFLDKQTLLENRLHAENIFKTHNFNNLYEFGNYYLMQDCLLLHSIVLTLFNTYLQDDINIFIRRNYSQSSLSYHQFFIIEPAKQIKQINAPKSIENTFFNYFIKQAVTGGLCTSFVHGSITSDTVINEHFNYLDDPNLNPTVWPNFSNCKPWKKGLFNELPIGISTIDIRSLYPSAALKPLPVNSPLFYSRFIPDDFAKVKDKRLVSLNLQGFCNNCQTLGNHHQDMFKLLNKPPLFYNEFNALKWFLSNISKDIVILRFQSSFTALGQLYFGEYPVDGFLSYKDNKTNLIHIKIIQYNSVFYHGHNQSCKIVNNDKETLLQEKTLYIKSMILETINSFRTDFNLNNIQIEYVEISDCDFFLHAIPQTNTNFAYKTMYSYNTFLHNIYNKKLKGFIVLKDLELKKSNQNPIFGFIIQKVEYELKRLSQYTYEQLQHFYTSPRVIGMNKSKSFIVLSTEYFNWLYNNFGFENTPDIYHAIFFQSEYYLKDSIENKLKLRKDLKDLIKNETNIEIKQQYEIKAELIKLMLNSCYGFTLCNLTSSKFKCYENRKSAPHTLASQNRIMSCVQITKNTYLIEKKNSIKQPFQSLLGHVGCSILFHSKIILLKRLYFLLKYLNPTKAQLLYMDTDSAHFLLKHKHFRDNVDYNLQHKFVRLFDKHFETGNKVSGIWVQEGFYDTAEYIGEKSYILYNKNDDRYLTHMKGLNTSFQNKYVKNKIDHKIAPYINYNIFFKSPDFVIYKSYMSKNLFSNYVPIKRYFISSTGSLPLKM